jgi:hypothetical protein
MVEMIGVSTATNIFSETVRVASITTKEICAYIAVLIGAGFLLDYLETSGNGGMLIGHAIATAMLAIPAHRAVLIEAGRLSGAYNLYSQGQLTGFWLRMAAVFIIMTVFVVIFMISFFSGKLTGVSVVMMLAVSFLILALILALMGTVFPAIVLETDNSFTSAFARARHNFGYSFSRLLAGNFLIFLILVINVIVVSKFAKESGDFIVNGSLDFATLIGAIVANLIWAVQIIMTSVVLSRAYLRAEAKVAPAEVTSVQPRG